MANQKDTFRMLATPYTDARIREMQKNGESYILNLSELRTLPFLKRAQALARIQADIPALIKKRIPLRINGATVQETDILKKALRYT